MREVPVIKTQEAEISFSKKSKILFFASIGNALELYDYTLYAVMIPFLAPLFFPSENASMSLIFGYISFAIAFIFAPIGSIFWGWYGDRFGRIGMLKSSMIMMAIPSLAIAMLPTFETIGWFAPIILILLRVVQGVSASGEIKGSKIFAMEHLGFKYYGISSGIVSAAGGIGVMFAMIMAYLTTQYSDIEYFWRIPFLIGSCLYIVGVIMRSMLTETKEFKQSAKDQRPISDLKNILIDNLSATKIAFMLGGLLGVFSYMMHAFMPPFLGSLGFEKAVAYKLSIIALISTAVFSVITGYYSKKNFADWTLKSIWLIAISTPIYFLMIPINELLSIAAYIGLGANLGIFACMCSIVMFCVFPTQVRCRGVLFNYALGVGLCGGFTPLILKLLSGFSMLLPAIAVSLFAILTLCVFRKEVRNVTLS
jgi:MFS transporter, MHS family, proline/betaine transporter